MGSEQMAAVRNCLAGVTAEEPGRTCNDIPVPGLPSPCEYGVGFCRHVLVDDERAHHGFVVRDLAVAG